MELVDKADRLAEFWALYSDDPSWSIYRQYNDLALPYAFGMSYGHILDMSDEAVLFIEEAYDMLCGILKVDKAQQYDSVEAMFDDADWSE
jgi:hypothetical protein